MHIIEKKNTDPIESFSKWLASILSVLGLIPMANQWSFAGKPLFKIIFSLLFVVFAFIGIVRPIYYSRIRQKGRLVKVGYSAVVTVIFACYIFLIFNIVGQLDKNACLRVPSTRDISQIQDSIPTYTTHVSLEAALHDSCGIAFRDQLFVKLMAIGYENLSVTTITNQEDYFKDKEPYTILKANNGNTPQIIITINPQNH